MLRLIAVRHGQSEFNLRGLCNDDPRRSVNLTERGRQQAAAAAVDIALSRAEVVFTSPLPRAVQTAAIVARRLGLATRQDDRLADIRSGCDGRPVAEYLEAIAHDPVDARLPGGESLRDYHARVAGFLDAVRDAAWSTIVVVAHEETLRIIHACAHRLPLADVVGMPFANGCPYTFQFDRLKR
jgi:broad specificity phosphatase PhoE